MKLLIGLLAWALLCVVFTACGSGKSSSPAPGNTKTVAQTKAKTATVEVESPPDYVQHPDNDEDHDIIRNYTQVDADKDNDIGAPADDRNNNSVLHFGAAASATDTREVTALLKSYYAAALADDGAKACSMVYLTLANSVAEDQGKGSPGAPYLKEGTTCPSVLKLLFQHFHKELSVEVPQLKVKRVRLRHGQGLAVLSFGKLPERQISVGRERHAWKLLTLVDSELP
jgi:hypothetical protein